MFNLNQLIMNNDRNRKDNHPASPDRKEINPANRSMEGFRNPDSDNDRTGRNIDMDLENRKNKMEGREQQTSPKSTAESIVDRFNRRDDQQNQDSGNK